MQGDSRTVHIHTLVWVSLLVLKCCHIKNSHNKKQNKIITQESAKWIYMTAANVNIIKNLNAHKMH
jgi:hypothetical protein